MKTVRLYYDKRTIFMITLACLEKEKKMRKKKFLELNSEYYCSNK